MDVEGLQGSATTNYQPIGLAVPLVLPWLFLPFLFQFLNVGSSIATTMTAVSDYALLVGAAMFCHILEAALASLVASTRATSSKTRKALLAMVPASGVFIGVGAILGCLMWAVISSRRSVQERVGFSVTVFNTFLLPPIIFDGALSLKQLMFWRNLSRIATLAILGTIISTAIVGSLTFLMGSCVLPTSGSWLCTTDACNACERGHARIGVHEDLGGWAGAMAFGALISATDPVASLVTFSQMDINNRLYAIVFGEAILNDAIAIVLFDTSSVHARSPLVVVEVMMMIETANRG